ncbi:hypothetical protein PLICRDRAFT_227955 [Plicaturopsis crispa FD-325 SS-3]|nr:hypothetical protein PLICRDRAFT_227955 [Plicaturopsis crispa FD-325 SS-3]
MRRYQQLFHPNLLQFRGASHSRYKRFIVIEDHPYNGEGILAVSNPYRIPFPERVRLFLRVIIDLCSAGQYVLDRFGAQAGLDNSLNSIRFDAGLGKAVFQFDSSGNGADEFLCQIMASMAALCPFIGVF